MKMYAFAALAIAVIACYLVFLSLDHHTTNIRRIVLISVMTALSVSGRFIFAMVPGFKPMTAIIVLTGMYLGGEAGFLCGAFTALISNIYFGQGPWTPFQMFAFGILGFIAGMIARPLKRHTALLVIYGIIAGVLYSFIMDIWTVLWFSEGFKIELYIIALGTAVPYTIAYAVSNVVFLLLFKKPFGKKLGRIVIKYGV